MDSDSSYTNNSSCSDCNSFSDYEQRVRELAYFIYLETGNCDELQNWLTAENQLRDYSYRDVEPSTTEQAQSLEVEVTTS